ncbi:unnamed protein product [Arctia plantaginis]|uniref:Uncharacterized protein n=1 Tax=Arctia plantaginis TaxID=874455 RepID=A0A8S1B1A8_ARCPL|nr:unnamed protein product [Arctia plantaginis]CAB3252062.1 unnamed protein product [Arctia plantaginis]
MRSHQVNDHFSTRRNSARARGTRRTGDHTDSDRSDVVMILTKSSRRPRGGRGEKGPVPHSTSLTQQHFGAARACTRRATWPCPCSCQRAAIDREPAARRPATDARALRAHRPPHPPAPLAHPRPGDTTALIREPHASEPCNF